MALQNNKKNTDPLTEQPEQAIEISSKVIPKVNKYYLKVSKNYRTAQFLALIVLLVYLFFILTTFGSHITYDNIKYLMRDLDSMMTRDNNEFTQIKYPKQNEQVFTVFKNGIAAAGKESVLLFDSTGLQLCKDRLNYNDPVLVPSEKYLLLYDMGGKEYSVYNSISRVISRTTDHKIIGGDMSDTGAFILVTRSNETKYVVEHYNNSLNRTMRIFKDNYVMDAAVSKDGKQILICSAIPFSTDLDCEISLYTAGNSEGTATIVLPRTMPLSVHFTDTGFIVLCDNGLYFYDMAGKEIAATPIKGFTLKYADLSDHYTVLAGSENSIGSTHRIMVFSKDGSILADTVLNDRVTGVSAPSSKDPDTYSYILTPNSILRLGKGDQQAAPLITNITWDSTNTEISDVMALLPSREGIIAFTDTAAYYLFN